MLIVTDNIPQNTLDWNELNDKERNEFYYLNTIETQNEAKFVRFRDVTYHLNEFLYVREEQSNLVGWDGYNNDSYFSCVLVRYVENEQVVMGVGIV